MPARNLTDRFIRSVATGGAARLEFMDATATGLCLRVTPRGRRTFSFLYRPRDGGPKKRYTLGDYPAWSLAEARDKALELRRAVQEGRDPIVEVKRARDALTLTRLVERYLVSAKKRLRSADQYEALFKRNVIPVFGDRKAASVERVDVAMLLDQIAVRAPSTANRTQAALSSVYVWAINEGLASTNPVAGLKPRHVEVPKDRVLTDDEILRLWRALDGMAPAYRDVLRLVLLTGQRPGECAGITVDEVDLKANVWTIPSARSKNKHAHTVPLLGAAREIVERLAKERSNGSLVLTPRGVTLTSQNLAKAVERIPAGTFDAPATAHDLRRTAATIMARLGVDRMHVAAVLNHMSTTRATVTGSVYDRHSYLNEKSSALATLDREIDRIIYSKQPDTTVLHFRRGDHATP